MSTLPSRNLDAVYQLTVFSGLANYKADPCPVAVKFSVLMEGFYPRFIRCYLEKHSNSLVWIPNGLDSKVSRE